MGPMRQSPMTPGGHGLPELYAVVVNYTAIFSLKYVCLVWPSFFDGGAKKIEFEPTLKQQTHCIERADTLYQTMCLWLKTSIQSYIRWFKTYCLAPPRGNSRQTYRRVKCNSVHFFEEMYIVCVQ